MIKKKKNAFRIIADVAVRLCARGERTRCYRAVTAAFGGRLAKLYRRVIVVVGPREIVPAPVVVDADIPPATARRATFCDGRRDPVWPV